MRILVISFFLLITFPGNCQLIPSYFNDEITVQGFAPVELINFKKNLIITQTEFFRSNKPEIFYQYKIIHLNDSLIHLKSLTKRKSSYYVFNKGEYKLSNRRGKIIKSKYISNYRNGEEDTIKKGDTIIVRIKSFNLENADSTFLFKTDIIIFANQIVQIHRVNFGIDSYSFYSYPDSTTKITVDSTYNTYYKKYLVSKSKYGYKLNDSGQVASSINETLNTYDGQPGKDIIHNYFYKDKICYKREEYFDGSLRSIIEITFID